MRRPANQQSKSKRTKYNTSISCCFVTDDGLPETSLHMQSEYGSSYVVHHHRHPRITFLVLRPQPTVSITLLIRRPASFIHLPVENVN